ncbi:MAG: bifunctional DNA-formamidopyrimidine glycosylase/DNA-(apurinic or apyrimidinic site) lyase [Candidatus Omnitrophica bacterium]|nr:bifunctional DNA-formamidopyrimidine glycosylase/DNA-(apurinic or apyrimidinic site) lyase [Candidatus Omnitrophota bacterium]
MEKAINNKNIVEVCVFKPKIIKEPDIAKFKRILTGARFLKVARRGKLLILKIQARNKQVLFLTIHLRMSGQLVFGAKSPSSRLCFKLSDKKYLSYNDQRLLGEVRLVHDWRKLKLICAMGPEPLDKTFTREKFQKRIAERTGKVKAVLLDQKFIAGLGNIYAAEVLFHSRINPMRQINTLDNSEIGGLFRNIKKILNNAIICRGTSFSDYRDGKGNRGDFFKKLSVYGRAGQACRRCKNEIERIKLGGRGTYFCGRCQR